MKRNIYLLYAIGLLQGMVFYASVATLYREAAGLSIFQITLIESLSMALTLLLEIPWGMLADQIGYRRTLLLCSWLYFFSKIIFWQADSFGLFVLERLLLSVVCAGLSGVETSMLYLSCEGRDSQRVFGWYEALQTAGLFLASSVYALLPQESLRLAALLTVISYGLAALCALGLKEVVPERPLESSSLSASLSVLKDTLSDPRLLLLVIGVALLNETHQTITVFLNQLQYTAAGLSHRAIALAYIGMTLVGLLSPLSARLTEWFGPLRLGSGLFLTGAAACLTLAVTRNAFLSLLAILLLRLAFSLLQPLQTELQNRAVSHRNRATALSMNSALMSVIAVFTNLLFGRAAERRLSLAMALGCLLCLLGWRLYVSSQRSGTKPEV